MPGKVLWSQVKQKKALLPEFGLQIVLASEIDKYFGADHIFLYDEYVKDFTEAKLECNDEKEITPIFQLGKTEKLIISTGHRSKETDSFLE